MLPHPSPTPPKKEKEKKKSNHLARKWTLLQMNKSKRNNNYKARNF